MSVRLSHQEEGHKELGENPARLHFQPPSHPISLQPARRSPLRSAAALSLQQVPVPDGLVRELPRVPAAHHEAAERIVPGDRIRTLQNEVGAREGALVSKATQLDTARHMCVRCEWGLRRDRGDTTGRCEQRGCGG